MKLEDAIPTIWYYLDYTENGMNKRLCFTIDHEHEMVLGRNVMLYDEIAMAPELMFSKNRFVSRQHAVIKLLPQHSGAVGIEDLCSNNGTFVNDVQIKPGQPYILKNGDRIRFGKKTVECIFTWKDNPDHPFNHFISPKPPFDHII